MMPVRATSTVTLTYRLISSSTVTECIHTTKHFSDAGLRIERLRERTVHLDIYFFFLPITQLCSISDVLFTGGRGVSDCNVLKHY